MPTPVQDKLRILQEIGVDPEKYWLDDTGNIVDAPKQSTLGAGLSSALYNAPRTAAGFGGAALGAAGAGALGLPSGPGAVATGIAGATAGGAAGSALGELIQSSLYPESWQLAQQMREVRNPGATKVADLASQAVLMRPSFKMAKAAATAPLDFIRSAGQISPNNAAALGNMAIGGALGGGMALGQGGSTADVLEALAAGTLLSQPTKLGQKLSRDVFMPWKPQPTWNQATAGMQEAFGDRVSRANKANQDAVVAENVRLKEEFDAAVARGEAPMPIDPVRAREYQPAPIEAELGVSPTEAWMEKWRSLQEQMKAKFNVGNVADDAGNAVAGRMTPRPNARGDAAIDVSPDAYADTPAHEYVHLMFEDALNYGSPREKAFTERMLGEMGLTIEDVGGRKRISGSMEEFVGPREENAPRGEEELTQSLGEDIVRRAVNPAQNDTLRQAMSDFADYYLKNRVTPESARRMLSGRLMYGRGTAPSVSRAAGVEAGRELAQKQQEAQVRSAEAEALATEQARKAELDRLEAENLRMANDERARKIEALRAEVDRPAARSFERTVGVPAEEGAAVPEGEMGYQPSRGPVKYENPTDPTIRPGDLNNIDRPERIDYTGESIPANIRRGRTVRENLEESPEDLELRRIEDRLSGRDRSKYQPFSTDFEKELANARPFKIQVSKDGRMAGNDIRAAVGKLNPTEQELLKSAGLEDYLRRVARPTAAELKEWAEANVPRVEVKELSADGRSTEAQKELARLQHELDNIDPAYGTGSSNRALTPEQEARASELLRRIEDITYDEDPDFTNDSATRGYDYANINPRELADMPGAVDLLVRVPRRKRDMNDPRNWDSPSPSETEPALYKSSHYPQSGDNLLAHLRAYVHTMPNGERVLRVFEVQSDWAQDYRKAEALRQKRADLEAKIAEGEAKLRAQPVEPGYAIAYPDELTALRNELQRTPSSHNPPANHPLLPHHQRLALKAAIEHARKLGIKKVVVDNAETAMLTEGHDKVIKRAKDFNGRIWDTAILAKQQMKSALGNADDGIGGARWHIEQVKNPDFKWSEGGLEYYHKGVVDKMPFEGGMKLSYDNVLQQMMRDLSGDGVRVEMGEHRNATYKSEYGSETPAVYSPRPDLIFKNPDGSPKTQSTGFAYDTSAVQARRDTGEPFSYAGRKYQRFGPGRQTSNLPDADRKGFSPFESSSQKVARSTNPVVRTVGRVLTELFPAQRAMQGKYRALPEAFEGLNEKDKDLLYEIVIDEDRSGTPAAGTVPARLRQNYKALRAELSKMRKDQIANKHYQEDGTVPGEDPTYFPNVVDPSVRRTMANESDTPRYKQLKQEFLDFNKDYLIRVKGKTAAEADKLATQYFDRFIGTLSKQPVEGAFDFGAVSLPAGSKLPDNWLHADPAAAMRQYVRDWSRSRTFHDNVMTNEDVMAGLGSETYRLNGKTVPVTKRVTPVIKDDDIRFLLNEAVGVNVGSSDKVTSAIGRAASTLWLANPITRSVDVATSLFKGLGMVRPSQIPGLVSNLRSIGQSMERAYDTGWIKNDGNTIVGEVLGAGEQFTNAVDKFSRGLSKYTGSEKLENFGRGLSQNIGEYIARTNSALAKSGDKRAIEFLNRVADNWSTLSEAELGTRIGQLFQGRYDATNLPRWLADSPAAPFFSLARWNIEQWNNFREFAIEPAKKGDVAPLISMLVAGLAGGVGVKEIREALGGRKSKVATIREIVEAPEGSAKYIEGVRYLGNLAQLTGTMGIVSEMGNWALDIASKDKPQGLSMPALEVTSDIIPRLVAAGVAIADGQDPLTVLTAVGRDIGNEHVSAYRFLETNAGRLGVSDLAAEDLADANARRDLRVGKRLRGEPVRPAVGLPIDYSRAEERRVEKTRDRGEMMGRARELRADILAEPDRDRRTERMRSAAASRPSYLPSPESDPRGFREQLDFVRRTQGPEAEERLRRRYLRDKGNADVRRKMFNP